MSDASAQSRVLFLFPDSSELRSMREPPKLGRRVRSVKGDVWTVAEVLKSGIDTYTVTCAPPPGGVRDLAADLLELARNSISPPRHAVPVSPTEEPRTDKRTRETNCGRTVLVPIDQRMTDVPDWVIPPDVPNASDAPFDSQDRSGKHSGDGADTRDHARNAYIKEEAPLPDYVPAVPPFALRRH